MSSFPIEGFTQNAIQEEDETVLGRMSIGMGENVTGVDHSLVDEFQTLEIVLNRMADED